MQAEALGCTRGVPVDQCESSWKLRPPFIIASLISLNIHLRAWRVCAGPSSAAFLRHLQALYKPQRLNTSQFS